jgi:DNA-binding response OmpR family regulator/outer membrane murein-binding lipoprotein Lpp
MSKKILIVERDPSLSSEIKIGLEGKGFTVDETSDAKGALETIRSQMPDLVLLAVELAAGQNGYLVCGKIKKDDQLKQIPVILIGSPEGFAQHRKLKTRAEEYVAKPVDPADLAQKIGGLIGLPETSSMEIVDESLTLSDLVEDEPEAAVVEEELSVSAEDEEISSAHDADLEMLDAAFEQISLGSNETGSRADENVEAPPETSDEPEEEAIEALAGPELSAEADAALENLGDEAAPSELPIEVDEAALADLHEELPFEGSDPSSDDQPQPTDKGNGDEPPRSNAAWGEAAAPPEDSNKKEREVLRLKSELNRRDQEIIDLREREMKLEQELAHSSGEVARRDAQIKTISSRVDQLISERKKTEQQLAAAKAELRSGQAEAQKALEEVERLQRDLEVLRSDAQSARREAEDARGELDSVKAQLTHQAEEAGSLRQKTVELEQSISKHEERVAKFYQKLKDDEKIREKAKKALSIALHLLEEQQRTELEDGDEPAEA